MIGSPTFTQIVIQGKPVKKEKSVGQVTQFWSDCIMPIWQSSIIEEPTETIQTLSPIKLHQIDTQFKFEI